MIRIAAAILFANLAVHVASNAPIENEEKKDTQPANDKPAINLNAPAAPPESVEARLALRQHRPVSALNRYTFRGNVLEGIGDHVDHWIVMFCPGWHDKCQGLLASYELLGVQWENKQNKELVMTSSVRFAKVDCATEKALCVSLDIDDYPSVVHYRNNQRMNSWHGGAPGLVRFVKQELEGPKKRRARPIPKATHPATCTMDDAPDVKKPSEGNHHQLAWLLRSLRFTTSPWRIVGYGLLLIAAARTAWALVSGSIHKRRQLSKAAVVQGSSKQLHSVHSTRVQSCLPQEWAERQSIEL